MARIGADCSYREPYRNTVIGCASEKVTAKIGKETTAIQSAVLQYRWLIPSRSPLANIRAAVGVKKVVKLSVTSSFSLEAGKTARKVATLLVPQKCPSTRTLMV